jgi:hypothetical protein
MPLRYSAGPGRPPSRTCLTRLGAPGSQSSRSPAYAIVGVFLLLLLIFPPECTRDPLEPWERPLPRIPGADYTCQSDFFELHVRQATDEYPFGGWVFAIFQGLVSGLIVGLIVSPTVRKRFAEP